jgi:peptide deformylase
MVLPIYVYGSPILRKKAQEIDSDYPGLETLIENMFDTMKSSDGIGLAAPQIGKSIKIIVVDATALIEDDPTLIDFRKVFINPEIINREGEKVAYKEGCLSLPNIREEVIRHSKITIRYLDENFQEHEETYEGVRARITQHEYDHLEGILFIDRINPIKRKLLTSRLNAMSKGKFESNYKTKVVR